MSVFDELTMAEVDDMQSTCLDGVSVAEADPMRLSGAVMWIIGRRTDPALEWDAFRAGTTMGDIRRFSEEHLAGDEAPDPTIRAVGS